MDKKDVAVRQETAVINKEEVTKETIMSYMTSFNLVSNLQPNEIQQFVEIAMAYKLNPFKREIYCVPYNGQYGRKLSIITGYEVYLKRAERCGDLNGWTVATAGAGDDLKAIVTIHRKSWSNPFVHEVLLKEYNQGNQMWKSKPITMLKKVAVAQAFRMAFPDEFGGMPYTSDELPDEMTNVTASVAKPVLKEPGIKKPDAKIAEGEKKKEEPIEVAVVVSEEKPKEKADTEETKIMTITQNTSTHMFKIKTEPLGDFITSNEALAKIARANKGGLVDVKYTVDNDFNRVLTEIMPKK